MKIAKLVVEIRVFSRCQLHSTLQGFDALLVADLERASLLVTVSKLRFQHLNLGLQPMQLAGVFPFGFLDLHAQVCVLLVQNVRCCHDSQVVLEALGEIFTQLEIKKHYLVDSNLPARQVNHVDLLYLPPQRFGGLLLIHSFK